MNLTDNQTVLGTKTFSAIPIFNSGTVQIGSSAGSSVKIDFNGKIAKGNAGTYGSNDAIATAIPPAVNALPFMNNFKAYQQCIYSKNQFNEVVVNFSTMLSGTTNDILSGSYTIAKLPVGHRPAGNIDFAITGDSQTNGINSTVGLGTVGVDGSIVVSPLTAAMRVKGSVVFVAVQ